MEFRGIDLTHPINRIRAGFAAMCVNVRSYLRDGFTLRNRLTDVILLVSAAIQTIQRLNDSTPLGPVGGFTYTIKDASGNLYSGTTGSLTAIAIGMSVNPVSMIPSRPNKSVQPWDYIGDVAPSPTGSITYVTIHTKKAIDGTNINYNCSGMLKVRSDGLVYKMGIKEPQASPEVSTTGTTTSGSATLHATSFPWTNVGGANPSYNYGHSSGADGTAPVVIATPAGSQTLAITITGTATINGATHAPDDAGPITSTFPGFYIYPGGGAAFSTVIVATFTDGAGNVIAGSVGAPNPITLFSSSSITVPAGSVQCQIGIDSAGNTFSANSGSFALNWTLTSSAIATKVSTLGDVTTYYWGDSPHSGPVGSYIWKNPNDTTSSGTPRTTSTANGTISNNSWWFDSTPQDDTVPMQWNTVDSSGAVVGSIPVFTTPLPVNAPNFDNFNLCVVGTIFVPTAGIHTIALQYKDQILFGIGGGATLVGTVLTTGGGHAPLTQTGPFAGTGGTPPPAGMQGQTVTVVNALPIVYYGFNSGGGGGTTENTFQVSTFDVSFPASGAYQVEIDHDYWFHVGRSLIMTIDGIPVPPLPSGVRTNTEYRCVYRSSLTGAQSNPGPASAPEVTPVLDNTVTCAFSDDPQVDKVDYYRQDSSLINFTYVATGPNTNPPTAITDSLSDTDAALNPTLDFDNYEPFPSIDTPKSGTVNVSGNVISWASGDIFNIRWLAGTIIEIGSPTQLAYSAVCRPSSTTTWSFIDSTVSIPDGTGLVYNISEPVLAAQPLPYMAGPTDNINFVLAVGDPLRPGTLYWCKGSNLDSAPDTNQMDVTDPSEPLVNVAMSAGRGILFSTKRAWAIMPNFFNAEATAEGTTGSTWTLQATEITRGLYVPRCLAVEGGGNIFFRVNDGVHVSPGGLASQSITDDTLYNLFPHESEDSGASVPQPVTRNGVTIYPPDDSQPQKQQFNIVGNYLYYDYTGTDGNPYTLVFDIRSLAWVPDSYATPAITHAANEAVTVQGVLVGCNNGQLRAMASNGTEAITGKVLSPAIGGQGWQHVKDWTIEYSSNSSITLKAIAADAGNGSYGPPNVTLPSTGGQPTKLYGLFGANKFNMMWFEVDISNDPSAQVFLEGFSIQRKDWGSAGAYLPINPFAEQGGFGGQP